MAVGQLIWALATSVGLVAVLLASEPLFYAVKLAGAAYLVVLGVRSLLAALRSDPVPTRRDAGGGARLRPTVAVRQGIVNSLGNPKMAAFFASILPQFAPQGEGVFSTLVVLGVLFCVLTFSWLAAYATAVAALGGWLARSTVRRVVEGAAGAALIGFGVHLATERR